MKFHYFKISETYLVNLLLYFEKINLKKESFYYGLYHAKY